jgi:hypothetical protein
MNKNEQQRNKLDMKTTKLVKITALVLAISSTTAFAQLNLFKAAQDLSNLANAVNGANNVVDGVNKLNNTVNNAGGCFINSLGMQSIPWSALIPLVGLTSALFLKRHD